MCEKERERKCMCVCVCVITVYLELSIVEVVIRGGKKLRKKGGCRVLSVIDDIIIKYRGH